MGFAAWLRQILGLEPPSRPAWLKSRRSTTRAYDADSEANATLTAWKTAFDSGELNTPCDVHDRGAWDAYWKGHLRTGNIYQSFVDQMTSDASLLAILHGRGARTILCAGNGLSVEAIALALHGFHVTVLDISAIPTTSLATVMQKPEHVLHRIPGFRQQDDGAFSFGGDEPIDPAIVPEMHRNEAHRPKGGGSLSLIQGDLIDPAICPGPFDVVIERRTVQLFSPAERPIALERLVARLASPGTVVCHEHRGNWRPGGSRSHFAHKWFAARGFHVEATWDINHSPASPRLAWLILSTG